MSSAAQKRRPGGARPRASSAGPGKAASRGFPVAAGIAAAVAVAVVAIAAGAGWSAAQHRAGQGRLAGPLLRDSPPAPDFTLRDQDGQSVRMASLRGRVVALTFLYTKCPDACPLIAAKL